MLERNITTKLYGLEDVIIDEVENLDGVKHIHGHLTPSEERICPDCGSRHSHIHDRREVCLNDLDIGGMRTVLHLKKCRLECQECGKIYTSQTKIHPKRYRQTSRTILSIINGFRETVSATHIAKSHHVSVSTALRYFDLLSYGCSELPKVISIDEFKGNAGKEKYQCILVDAAMRKPVDVLPNRYENHLVEYFLKYSRDERKEVTYFVQDMNPHFKRVAEVCFPNATIVVDKFHVIRMVVWGLENVRKEEQRKLSKKHRIYFKRSKSTLAKTPEKLTERDKERLRALFFISPKLEIAYDLKNEFFEIMKSKDSKTAKELLGKWIMHAQSAELSQFNNATTAFINWAPYIANAFDVNYSNGYTEGCNNKTKVLKRACYGIRRFDRLKNRVLHLAT